MTDKEKIDATRAVLCAAKDLARLTHKPLADTMRSLSVISADDPSEGFIALVMDGLLSIADTTGASAEEVMSLMEKELDDREAALDAN